MSAINDVNNWLGRSTFSSDANLQGSVAEFRIFNRILSPGELMNDYQLGPTFAGSVIKWTGTLSGNWDVNTSSNWLAGSTQVKFQNGAGVLFDDTFTGTATVNLVSNVQPASVTVSNSIYNYTFSGSRSISGSATLTKSGSGTLYINNANTFTGPTAINGGVLAGTGSLGSPVTIGSGATLSPGTGSISTFTINSNLTFSAGSTTFMKVSLDGGVTNNDTIAGLVNVSYGGNLIITNLGATPFKGGEQFQLFTASGIGSGNFNSITILPAGIGSFNPASGVLTIVPPASPVINPPSLSGSTFTFTGTGGLTNGTYTILTTTNLTASLTNWITVTNGVFDASGNFSNQIPVLPSGPLQFYLIRIP
jgi:autotransporter-associated beta strand protein